MMLAWLCAGASVFSFSVCLCLCVSLPPSSSLVYFSFSSLLSFIPLSGAHTIS